MGPSIFIFVVVGLILFIGSLFAMAKLTWIIVSFPFKWFKIPIPKPYVLLDATIYESERQHLLHMATRAVEELNSGDRAVAREFRYEKTLKSSILRNLYWELKRSYFVKSEVGIARLIMVKTLLSMDIPEHGLIALYSRVRYRRFETREAAESAVQTASAAVQKTEQK